MAIKWKNYKGAPRAIAVTLAIVSAFSAMYAGFHALRGELLYDFYRSENYYNTAFFESVVQKKIEEIRNYAANNNRDTLAVRARDAEEKAAQLKTALVGVSEALSARYAALGLEPDVFDKCGADPEDYLSRYYALRPELRDKPDDGLFRDYAGSGQLSSQVGALWTASDLICSAGYVFTVSTDGSEGRVIDESDVAERWHSSAETGRPAYYGAETTAPGAAEPLSYGAGIAGETVMPTSAAPETAPAAIDTTQTPGMNATAVTAAPAATDAIAATESPETTGTAKSTDVPAPTAAAVPVTVTETTVPSGMYGEYEEYLSSLQSGDNESYAGSREIAQTLADCCLLREFLLRTAGTADSDKLRAMVVAAQGTDADLFGTTATPDVLSARFFFRCADTGEYLTNVPEYSGGTDAKMQSDGQIEGIPADVKNAARSAEWLAVIDSTGTETNLGNGTEGEASLRREALGYRSMSSYTADGLGGSLVIFGSVSAGASDLFSYIARDFADAKRKQPVLTAVAAIGAAVFLLSALYILTCGTKTPDFIDRLYNDWHFLISGGLAAAAGVAGGKCLVGVIERYGLLGLRYNSYFYDEHTWGMTLLETVSPLLFAAVALVLLEYLTSVIRNIRNGRLIAHSFWYCAPRAVVRQVKKQRAGIPTHYKKQFHVALIGGIVLILVLWIAELAMSDYYESGAYLFVCFLASAAAIALLVLVLRHIRGIDAIAEAAERIRNGDLTAEIDMTKLPRHLRPMADSVMRNRDGLRDAVEQSVKDERMKTALITNVSHDLKTPLTSIITYSDLLSKRELGDGEAEKYVGVINEKAIRLKRLIEDLVEASKASTGNIKINTINLNLCEIAMQAVGEYTDELEKRQLEAVVTCPEEGVTVFADSRQTWRIIENLLSNVKKYAMQGTRVYIDVRRQDGFGVIEIKNVSALPLNIPARELTQRFVRGDASRTTEGSGLGLSIARSLCELQGGRFEISIDGDLFKVCVALPLEALSDKG